ncbi:MAG: hypothetical protein HY369_02450 [Candidatus Aenigmarchaeota archaeon]|nr:hypothetical protein [Candidatus Aenigmarchaeota archaeon]
MKTPKIDLKQLKRQKRENFHDRLEFVDFYADWVKKQENATWSAAQKKLIHEPKRRRAPRSL